MVRQFADFLFSSDKLSKVLGDALPAADFIVSLDIIFLHFTVFIQTEGVVLDKGDQLLDRLGEEFQKYFAGHFFRDQRVLCDRIQDRKESGFRSLIRAHEHHTFFKEWLEESNIW